jgi:uncharacterized protein
MNILFDLLHPADVNLFRNTIFKLSQNGHKVFVAYRQRGVLEKIARNELPGFEIAQLGQHKKSLSGKIFSVLKREFDCFVYFKKNKIDLVVCQGLVCGISSKLLNVKIVHYDDDSEYKLTYYIGKLLADIDIMPDFMPGSGSNIVKHKGFKELAYLHPDYFKPDVRSLAPYGVKPGEYVFIREISNVSVNYQHQRIALDEIVNYLAAKNIKIILSIENKDEVGKYEKKCIILKEPVANLHTLINYSRLVISSGDTMAREACLMGVPCIYTGGRNMLANSQFINLGVMFKIEDIREIFNKIDILLDPDYSDRIKFQMNDLINTSYDDTNKVILDQVSELQKRIKK